MKLKNVQHISQLQQVKGTKESDFRNGYKNKRPELSNDKLDMSL